MARFDRMMQRLDKHTQRQIVGFMKLAESATYSTAYEDGFAQGVKEATYSDSDEEQHISQTLAEAAIKSPTKI